MHQPKAVLMIGLLCLALGACSTGSPAAPAAAEIATPTPKPVPPALEKPTYTVQRGEVADELKLLGRVAATLDEDVFFTQDGFVKTIYVKRTDVVTKGQLLAELDLGTLPNELNQAQIALDSAQLALDRSAEERVFAVRKAELDLEDARAALAELRKPPEAKELAAAQVDVEQARIALEDTRHRSSAAKTEAQLAIDQAANAVRDAQADYARVVELNGNKPDSQLTLDDVNEQEKARRAIEDAEADLAKARLSYDLARQSEVTAVAEAEQSLKAAQLALEALTVGPTREELAAAERAIRRAQVAIDEANSKGGDPEDEKRVEQARLDVENMQARVESGRIYAPFDGEVAEVSVKPGDNTAAYGPVVNVINPTEIELVVDSTLSGDLAKIGIGQQVNISFSRYPTRVLSGTVEQLPTTLTSTSSSVEADPAIHFSFDSTGLELDVGDLANIVLSLERKTDALWLPPQAVRSFDGRRFVVVQDGTRQRRVDVKVGIVTIDRIELLEGVKEGDVVIGQ